MKRFLTPLALFALALVVRALPWRATFADDRVYLFGADAWYHMRRVVYTVVRFPTVLEFDPYLRFPEGGEALWTPTRAWRCRRSDAFSIGRASPAAD